ncbi:transposase [Tenacibaculum sp. 190524A02b]|uniref:transposase n=1 Tax=Tenacibaculum vairaonense TaxID=3137860 RepID=UPI0031FB972B
MYSFNRGNIVLCLYWKYDPGSILNYFDNRSTNVLVEWFNAKIKAFRARFRDLRNVEFFLYKLTQVFV